MHTQLSHAHQTTRGTIFCHPAPHNLHWRDVRSLLGALADTVSDHNGKLTVTNAGHSYTFHTEHGSEVASWDDIKHLRAFLTESGHGDAKVDAHAPAQTPTETTPAHGAIGSQGAITSGQGPAEVNPGRAGASQPAGQGPASPAISDSHGSVHAPALAASDTTADHPNDAHKLTPPEESGVNLLVVIDHREARIYRTELRGTVPQRVFPDPEGTGRHLHRVDREANGQRRPEQTRFYSSVASALANADAILLFGGGTGASSAMEHLRAALLNHHPRLAAKIIGAVTVDETHLTEPQLLAKARELYKAHWATTGEPAAGPSNGKSGHDEAPGKISSTGVALPTPVVAPVGTAIA